MKLVGNQRLWSNTPTEACVRQKTSLHHPSTNRYKWDGSLQCWICVRKTEEEATIILSSMLPAFWLGMRLNFRPQVKLAQTSSSSERNGHNSTKVRVATVISSCTGKKIGPYHQPTSSIHIKTAIVKPLSETICPSEQPKNSVTPQ